MRTAKPDFRQPVHLAEALARVFEDHNYAQAMLSDWKCRCGKRFTSKEAHLAEVAEKFISENYRFKRNFSKGTYKPVVDR